jgi:large subunit ribosomal protein L17
MRHRVAGKQLSRTTSHRKALRRNMAASLFEHGAVRTTETKAKQLRRFVERLITIAQKGTLHARRQVIAMLGDRNMTDEEGEFQDKTVVQKLFDEIAPRYSSRPGGYTRIIRLSDRRIGDAGAQVLLQLIEETPKKGEEAAGTAGRRKRRAAKRHEAAAAVSEELSAEESPGPAKPEESDRASETEAGEENQEPQEEESQEK